MPAERRIVHHRRSGDGIATSIVGTGTLRLDPLGLELELNSLLPPVEAGRARP